MQWIELFFLLKKFTKMNRRNGIVSAGNWIVDHVKVLDGFPAENMLANIIDIFQSVGGGPNNVLTNLAKLNVNLPLYGAGLIGNDADGTYILDHLRKYGINADLIKQTDKLPTSFTDAMTDVDSGNRTFFHYRGANAILDIKHLEKIEVNAKIFHLAYLLLLDKLDEGDVEYGVKAARLLYQLRKKGFKTSIDVVSEEGDRFKKVITPCLPYVDYLIINEVEAAEITDIPIRNEKVICKDASMKAAQKLIQSGVQEIVIIHCPEGACLVDKSMKTYWIPSFILQREEIKGATGAGDAFCAGCLYGIHKEYAYEEILKLGHASARFNLLDPTSTEGAVSLKELNKFIEEEGVLRTN